MLAKIVNGVNIANFMCPVELLVIAQFHALFISSLISPPFPFLNQESWIGGSTKRSVDESEYTAIENGITPPITSGAGIDSIALVIRDVSLESKLPSINFNQTLD